MTLWRFFTTRYTDALETQVADLKSQLAIERQEVRRLTEALVPALQRRDPGGYLAAGKVNAERPQTDSQIHVARYAAHRITKADNQESAKCICGWYAESADPVEMQTAISEHYKESFKPLKAQRPKPSDVIARMEAESFEEAQKRQQA